MDPKTRFLAALALASTISALTHVRGAAAADMLSEPDLYDLYEQGDGDACVAYLNAYPNGPRAPNILNDMINCASDGDPTPGPPIY